MEIVNILGVNIHKISKKEALEKVREYLESSKQNYIVTPNPEIILEAHHDEEFFYILNHADLNLPDGIGLKFASWLIRANLTRITGADLTEDVLQIAERENKKVAIINWCCGLSSTETIEKTLREKYSKLNFIVEELERDQGLENCERIDEYKPEIMFVALGAPYQEKFIYHNLKKVPSVKLALGIGGAFDFLTGQTKRAPSWLRRIGMEWSWRLFSHPQERMKRAKRIYNAVFRFSFKILKWRFIMPWFYRPNVSCLLYKKEGERYKVLLVERKDQKGHWQLPQGGTDGLGVKEAGLKELREEIGNDKIEAKKVFKNLHKYKFPKDAPRHRGAVYTRHTGYKGQKQSLLIAEFVGDDNEIKINFWDHSDWKWVDSESLVEEVFEVRKPSAKKFLEKFRSWNA